MADHERESLKETSIRLEDGSSDGNIKLKDGSSDGDLEQTFCQLEKRLNKKQFKALQKKIIHKKEREIAEGHNWLECIPMWNKFFMITNFPLILWPIAMRMFAKDPSWYLNLGDSNNGHSCADRGYGDLHIPFTLAGIIFVPFYFNKIVESLRADDKLPRRWRLFYLFLIVMINITGTLMVWSCSENDAEMGPAANFIGLQLLTPTLVSAIVYPRDVYVEAQALFISSCIFIQGSFIRITIALAQVVIDAAAPGNDCSIINSPFIALLSQPLFVVAFIYMISSLGYTKKQKFFALLYVEILAIPALGAVYEPNCKPLN